MKNSIAMLAFLTLVICVGSFVSAQDSAEPNRELDFGFVDMFQKADWHQVFQLSWTTIKASGLMVFVVLFIAMLSFLVFGIASVVQQGAFVRTHVALALLGMLSGFLLTYIGYLQMYQILSALDGPPKELDLIHGSTTALRSAAWGAATAFVNVLFVLIEVLTAEKSPGAFFGLLRSFDVYRYPGQKAIAVKVGFSWPAFFFTVLWMLFSGLWGVAVVWFVLECALERSADTLGPGLFLAAWLALSLIPGLLGNSWVARKRQQQGYELVGRYRAATMKQAIAEAEEGKS